MERSLTIRGRQRGREGRRGERKGEKERKQEKGRGRRFEPRRREHN